MSQRGPYRRYLQDLNIPIPETTLRRRSHTDQRQLDDIQHNEDTTSDNESVDEPMPLDSPNADYFDSRENTDRSSSSTTQDEFGEEVNTYIEDEDVSSCDGTVMPPNSPTGSAHSSESVSVSGSDGSVGIEDFWDDMGEFDEEINERDNTNKKMLYDGCPISKEESELLILSYAMRFGLSDLALQSLIDLVDCHLPRQEHRSVYLLQQKFPKPSEIITHIFCPQCLNLVNFGEDGRVVCNCGFLCIKNDLKRQNSFFIRIPLKDQLIKLLQDKNISSLLENNLTNDTSDVHSGRVYTHLLNSSAISKEDLTLQWNTDGVQIFRSSKVSLWPIQVAVNNLPFKDRRDNMILCGLWLGPHKPEMNVFLKPFVEELVLLHNEGLQYVKPVTGENTRIKVHTILASVDSQARPLLQNLKTFRGKQGCSYCLSEGEECQVGRGSARVYRGDVGPLRTHEQHVEDTKEVVETGNVINGIKGPSVLLLLPLFNIVSSFVPDYLHCLCLGVVKTMVLWWQNGINKREPFYLGSNAKMEVIDSVLCTTKPPTEITRTPRSIKECKIWKAAEWKNFLLYYSLLCLQAVKMPAKYVDHWLLLVYSMHIFLQEKISPEQYSVAKKCIRKFVLSMEEIYNTPQLMKFNVHLLLHVPKSVKNFGALWAVSCFPYEHYNGLLAKMFQNSQAVPLQICKSYLRLQILKERGLKIFSANNSALCAKSLYETLTSGKLRSSYCTTHGNFVRFFGKPSIITLTLTQKVVIENFLKERVHTQEIPFYHRFIYKNTLFHVEGYERLKKRVNSTVLLQNGTVLAISHALVIRTIMSNRRKCILLGTRLESTNRAVCRNRSCNVSSDAFCKVMTTTPECVAIYPEAIRLKCVVMSYEEKLCVFPLVNTLERD